ncbi:Rho GTPase-activating protein 22 [Schistosoma japonicum]|nr:Rho GTPase-activating protein 22 [Schistosoma japonicum]
MKPLLSIQPNSGIVKPPDKYQGWLKKLGGKLRIWKERYYVLTDTHLYYYTGTDRKKLLGEFCLNFAEIEPDTGDLEYAGDKACLLLLKINGSSSSHNNHIHNDHPHQTDQQQQIMLCAPNPRERKLWLRAIRKVLYLRHGGALFGTHLNEVFPYTTSNNEFVPRIVYETVQFIRQNGLDTEGIFRKCGKQNAIQSLADLYDSAYPGTILIPAEHDVHLVSGLLKYYLRELPEPVIPYKYYDKLKAAGYRIADGKELSEIIALFDSLPSPNYNLLKYLCQFLFEVSEHEKLNRMSAASLASMFAPNFLRQQDEDPHIEMSASQLINHTVAEFIKAHQILFPHALKFSDKEKSSNIPDKLMTNMHKNLNTLPKDLQRIHIPLNSPTSRSKSPSDHDKLVTRSQNSFAEPVIYDKHIQLTMNSNSKYNNINHHHHENGRDNHIATTTSIAKIDNNNNNNVIDNHNSQIHKFNHNSNPSTKTKSSHDGQINNIVMRSPKRNYLDNNLTATIGTNYNNNEEKESRLQLRKLHTESGEYELGSLIDETEDNLHSVSQNTDSTEHTITNIPKKQLYDVHHIRSTKDFIKSPKKYFNSLPEHQHDLDLTKNSIKTRPEIPLQWSFNTDQKSNKLHQNDSDETYNSLNLDVLSKVYMNSEKLASLQTSNDTTDNGNGMTKPSNVSTSKDSFSNGHNKTQISDFNALKKRISLKEFIDCKRSNKVIHSESLDTHSPMEQIRYWRSVAAAAQANAAGQLAKTDKLTQELAKLRWDLSISHMENNLLRQNLASVQAELNHFRQIPNGATNYVKRDDGICQALLP